MANNYNFTITVWDGIGPNATYEIDVTVSSNPPPTITTSPLTTISYLLGDWNSHLLQWVLYNDLPGSGSFNVYRNVTTPIVSGTWSNTVGNNTVIIDVGGLMVMSYYNFTIITDNGNGASTQVMCTIIVNDVPQITADSTSPETLLAPTTGVVISWNATDVLLGPSLTYTISLGESVYASGTWVPSILINVSIGGLSPSTSYYLFTCTINDGYGGSNSSTILVKVNDVPTLNHAPGSVNYGYGATGNTILWTISDQVYAGFPSYTVYVNGVQNSTGSWPATCKSRIMWMGYMSVLIPTCL